MTLLTATAIAEMAAEMRRNSVKAPDGFYTMVMHPKAFMGLMDSCFQGFKYRRKAARLFLLASPDIARIYRP